MSFSAIIAPARGSMRSLVRPAAFSHHAARSLHASSSVLRKGKASRATEEFEEDEDDLDLDMFANTAAPTPVGESTDASVARAEILAEIKRISGLPNKQRQHPAGHLKKNVLTRYIKLCQSKEDVEGVKAALRGWRVMDKRIPPGAVDDLVGKCCKYGVPEIMFEINADPLTYGYTELDSVTLNRLQIAYLSKSSFTSLPPMRPDTELTEMNALLRLALLEKLTHLTAKAASTAAETPAEDADAQETAKTTKALDPLKSVAGWIQRGLIQPAEREVSEKRVSSYESRIRERGGEWEKALESIRAAGKVARKPRATEAPVVSQT